VIRPNSGFKGFTIVELLITMLVMGMVVTIIMNFMANGLVNSAIQGARSDLLFEAQTALDLAQNDIRLSAAAEDDNRWQDANAPSAPSNLFSWHSDGTTVILATAAQDNAGGILFEDAHKYITVKDNYIFFVRSGVLYKRVLAAPVTTNGTKTSCPAAKATANCPADKTLLHNVKSFSVRYLNGQNQTVSPPDARSVELSVQLKTTKYRHDITAAYTTRTVFRND